MGCPNGWAELLHEEEKYYYSAEYMRDILADKGALSDVSLTILDENYERCEGSFLSEGDSMCFLYALDNGLRSLRIRLTVAGAAAMSRYLI